jgi:hypothetical protein
LLHYVYILLPLFFAQHTGNLLRALASSLNVSPSGVAIKIALKPGEHHDPKAVEQELESLLNRLQPGWQREVVEHQFLPHVPATNAIVQARLGGLAGRPGPEVRLGWS